MGDGLIHATWMALAVKGDVARDVFGDLFWGQAGISACTWEPLGGWSGTSFAVDSMDAIRNGSAPSELPTCPKCLVMLDWRLENPE